MGSEGREKKGMDRYHPPPKDTRMFLLKKLKTSAVSTTDGWLKLNFASCVIRQTRSLGALLCFIWMDRYHPPPKTGDKVNTMFP